MFSLSHNCPQLHLTQYQSAHILFRSITLLVQLPRYTPLYAVSTPISLLGSLGRDTLLITFWLAAHLLSILLSILLSCPAISLLIASHIPPKSSTAGSLSCHLILVALQYGGPLCANLCPSGIAASLAVAILSCSSIGRGLHTVVIGGTSWWQH